MHRRADVGEHAIDSLTEREECEARHEQPDLFEAPEGEAITLDYAATGLTLRRHSLARTHLIARRPVDMTPWLGSLATSSRDFH